MASIVLKDVKVGRVFGSVCGRVLRKWQSKSQKQQGKLTLVHVSIPQFVRTISRIFLRKVGFIRYLNLTWIRATQSISCPITLTLSDIVGEILKAPTLRIFIQMKRLPCISAWLKINISV